MCAAVAAGLDPFDQGIGIDPFDRRFAGRIDRGGIDHVGVVEGGLEVVHVIAQAGEAVRLDHGDDPAGPHPFARGGQHRADFHRVVAIVVDHGHAIDLAHLGEAPLDPGELGEAGLDDTVGTAHLGRDAHRGERVLDVVAARHRQLDPLDPAVRSVAFADHRVEAVAAGERDDILAPDVGLGGKAIGHHAAIAHLGDHRLDFGVIDAQHRAAIERHVFDEFDEGLLDRFEIAVVIEVFRIDVGDDRDRAVEPQERTVALVRLDHHPFAGAEPGVGAVGVDDPAVDHGRIDPAGIEQRGDHAGGGGLAVGPGHRDGPLEAHQFGQHFRAADHRNALFEGFDHFGIVALDCGRCDDHRGIADVFGGMADHHLDPALAQSFDDIALGNVAALHGIAQVVHHLGNPGHADPADADEMDRADIGADRLHAMAPWAEAAASALSASRITSISGAPPKLSTRSARSLTALG